MEFVTITPSRSSLPSNVTSVLINAFLADYAFIIRPSTTVVSHKKHGLSHIYKERMNQENQRIKNSILSAQNELKKSGTQPWKSYVSSAAHSAFQVHVAQGQSSPMHSDCTKCTKGPTTCFGPLTKSDKQEGRISDLHGAPPSSP